MKKHLHFFVLASILFTLIACDEEKDDPTFPGNYDLIVDNVGYNLNLSNMTASASGLGKNANSNITIPPTVNMNGRDFTVTSIGGFAFSNVSEVVLPNTIETIKGLAFKGCDKLIKINIPSSVTSIGINAFLDSRISQITIPASVTEIDAYCFAGCKKLRTMTIEDSEEKLQLQLEIYKPTDNPSGYFFEELYVGRTIRDIASIPRRKLVFGELVKYVGTYNGITFDFPLEIWSYAKTPPQGNIKASNDALMNSTVYVPQAYLETYREDSQWGKFWNIVGI